MSFNMMLIVPEIFIEIKILNIAQIPKKGTKNSRNQKYPTSRTKGQAQKSKDRLTTHEQQRQQLKAGTTNKYVCEYLVITRFLFRM